MSLPDDNDSRMASIYGDPAAEGGVRYDTKGPTIIRET